MRTIITDGDSWTFGSEIAPPHLWHEPNELGFGPYIKEGFADWSPENDSYRIPKIWPTILGQLLDCEVVNLAFPARSNDTIYASITSYILREFVAKDRPTNDVTVVVGWSSPERKNVYLQDFDGKVDHHTLWPNLRGTDYYHTKLAQKFFQFYVNHQWVEREYITRYVDQCYNLYMFCKLHGVKLIMYNSFYAARSMRDFSKFEELNITDILTSWKNNPIVGWGDHKLAPHEESNRLIRMWDEIPKDTFLMKDEAPYSFKGYIDNWETTELKYVNVHPAPAAHKHWAEYLYEQLK